MIDRDEAAQLAAAFASCSPRVENDGRCRVDLRGVLNILSSHSAHVSFSLDEASDGSFRLRTATKGAPFPELGRVPEEPAAATAKPVPAKPLPSGFSRPPLPPGHKEEP